MNGGEFDLSHSSAILYNDPDNSIDQNRMSIDKSLSPQHNASNKKKILQNQNDVIFDIQNMYDSQSNGLNSDRQDKSLNVTLTENFRRDSQIEVRKMIDLSGLPQQHSQVTRVKQEDFAAARVLTTSDYSDGLDVDDNVSDGMNAQSLGHYNTSV